MRRSLLDIDEETGSENEIREHFAEHSKVSAFVSIMQGCNMNCDSALSPRQRGRERYRSMEDIVSEVVQLGSRGARSNPARSDCQCIWQRIFARKDGKTPFVQLLERIHEIESIDRIRFTSPHPTSFGDDLIDAYGRLPKLCSYAHLPMQSGSDRILKAMNRPYAIDKFLSIVAKLRTTDPFMRLSTGVIVGFPGETDKDFELTKQAFSQAAFEHAFVFKYSERSGTPAAQFEDKVPQEIKENRNQELLSMTERVSYASNEKLIGKSMEVLGGRLCKKRGWETNGADEVFQEGCFRGIKQGDWFSCFCSGQEANPYFNCCSTIKMELFEFSILTSLLLFAIGSLFASGRTSIYALIRGFPRSSRLSVFCLLWVCPGSSPATLCT